MDWTGRSNTTEPVTIALIASPADVPVNDPAFKGFLLFNPGGPSTSGVDYIVNSLNPVNDTFRKFLPSLVNYTIIGFDPRGVGKTSPSLDCFQTMAQVSAFQQLSPEPLIRHHSASKVHAKWRSLWATCQLEIQSYAGTQDVARDMLEIHNKLWAAQGSTGIEHDVNYFGVSYGTALGQTFAQMYPDRVGRFLLDSVIDIHDMTSGKFEHYMDDVDKTFNRYLELCLEAGVEKCPFAANTTTPAEIEQKLVRLLERLEDSPMPLLKGATQAGYIGSDSILTRFRNLMYLPMVKGYESWGQILELVNNEVQSEELSAFFAGPVEDPVAPLVTQPYLAAEKEEVLNSIYCASGAGSVTLPQLRKKLVKLEKQTRYGWGVWGNVVAGCSGWKAPSLGIPKIENYGTATKNPILFAGSGFDVVTPLNNARVASKLWKDSGVLSVPEAIGHSVFSARSKCAERAMSEFFQDGVVSKEEIRCKLDEQLFEKDPTEEEQQQAQ